jgi:hypothetical protein
VKKTFSILLILSAFTIILGSWGSTGHRKINGAAYLSFNQQMQDFLLWSSFLADHASDADYRKQNDPNEGPKHYIDINNYYAFLLQGRIPQTLDSVVNLYGSSFVYGNGILPYATIATVNLLKQSFESNNMEAAKTAAADLGHYVADGHMPLHITSNYDGDETGNSGIHSRYESSMINTYEDELFYSGDSISVIPDVTAYVFNYIYTNHTYVDSVLDADTYAHSTTGSTNSSAYKQALWNETKGFTTMLFKQASHSLTELIYTAWVNAGSPSITANAIEEYEASHGNYLGQVFPNPFTNSTRIKYSLLEKESVKIQLHDNSGKIIQILVDENKEKGSHEFEWTPNQLPEGMYLLVMKAGNTIKYRKIIHLN